MSEPLPSRNGFRPRVLFVEEDADQLATQTRQLRSDNYDVVGAAGGASALELLRSDGSFAVLVTNLRLSGMDGMALVRAARVVSPQTIRVLVATQAELGQAVQAINEGAIFRFLIAPCSRILLAFTIKAAVEQHRLLTIERILLERTVHDAIRSMMDILGLLAPLVVARATRLRLLISSLANIMNVRETWHLELAAMLSQIGYVNLPPLLLERFFNGVTLHPTDEATMLAASGLPEQFVGAVQGLEPVLESIRYRFKNFDGSGPPPGDPKGEAIPWGARALRALEDYDTLESQGMSTLLACETMRARAGFYDPAILDALPEAAAMDRREDVREVPPSCIVPGMVIAQHLKSAKGVLFVARGQEVSAGLVEKIRGAIGTLLEDKPVRVIVRQPAR